jgi:hypothetical protein
MSTPWQCRIGLHTWHAITDEHDVRLIACLRCGRREAISDNVAIRLGWDQHTHG